jgi:hypothetical protein
MLMVLVHLLDNRRNKNNTTPISNRMMIIYIAFIVIIFFRNTYTQQRRLFSDKTTSAMKHKQPETTLLPARLCVDVWFFVFCFFLCCFPPHPHQLISVAHSYQYFNQIHTFVVKKGTPCGARTHDKWLIGPLLYQLS